MLMSLSSSSIKRSVPLKPASYKSITYNEERAQFEGCTIKKSEDDNPAKFEIKYSKDLVDLDLYLDGIAIHSIHLNKLSTI